MFYGDRLKQLLEQNRMTQHDFAVAVGCSEVAVSRYVKGLRTPHVNLLTKMAYTLDTSVDYLLGWEDPAAREEKSPEVAFGEALVIVEQNCMNWSENMRSFLIKEIKRCANGRTTENMPDHPEK